MGAEHIAGTLFAGLFFAIPWRLNLACAISRTRESSLAKILI
jgi:hypothetical protein